MCFFSENGSFIYSKCPSYNQNYLYRQLSQDTDKFSFPADLSSSGSRGSFELMGLYFRRTEEALQYKQSPAIFCALANLRIPIIPPVIFRNAKRRRAFLVNTKSITSKSSYSSSSSYKALQPIYGVVLLNRFLPNISILCYFLPIAYAYAFYIFQNVIF